MPRDWDQIHKVQGALEEFYNSHHVADSQAVHKYRIWVNNLTDEPCIKNPCLVCIRNNKLGIKPMEPNS